MAEPGKKFVKIDKEMLAALRPFAEAAGVEIPGLVQHQPTVDLDVPVSDLGRQLGALCSRQPIFRRAGAIVAADDEGQMVRMTPERLGGWVEKFVTTTRWTKERGDHAASMPMELAKKVLATDQFLSQVRELLFFFPVRLPVTREDGTVELIAPGYDAQTKSYTEEEVSYDEDMGWDEAVGWLEEILGEWPFADRLGREAPLCKSRDAAVILAGLLGTYGRCLYAGKRPMGVVSGNQPGTGKTTLAKLMMAMVFGLPPEMSLPATDEKFERLLESVALGMEPVLFLDDVGKMIRSNALNKFVTASKHGGTRLYTQESFSVPAVTQVFVTGNDLPIEENVKRRVMWCELFLAGEVQDREFKQEITDDILAGEKFRAKTLAALWAVVKEWGRVREERPLGTGRKILKSFEGYCRRVGEFLDVIGWADPFVEAPGMSGGDQEGKEFMMLLLAAADQATVNPCEYRVPDMVEIGRTMGILEYFLGAAGDGDLPKKERIAFGKRLAKFRGRHFQRTDGRFYECGKRDGKGGSVYVFRFGERQEDLR